jgi:WD40 repeat protein
MPKLADATRILSYPGHMAPIYRLALHSDSGFCSAGSDGFLVRWKHNFPDFGTALIRTTSPIFAIESEEESVYAGLFDGKIISNTGLEAARSASIFGLELFDKKLFCVGKEGDFSVFDLSSKKVLFQNKLSLDNLRCVIKHPILPLIVVSGSDGKIRILELEGMREIEVLESHKASVFVLEFSKDGKKLYTAGRDAHIKVFDFDSLKLLQDVPAHFFSINDLKLIYGDKYLASASMDKTIRIWRTQDMKLMKVIDKARNNGHSSSVNALLWNEKSETLISAGDDKNIFEWKIEFYD